MDDTNEISKPFPTEDFMSATELVSVRKVAEESSRRVIGEKLNTLSDKSPDDESLQCTLQNYEATLKRKCTGRICDLMQAEWNPVLNATVVSKLKGKFTQHMGRLVDGKIILSPEESVFLLEVGSIEIMNNGLPMSTEEAYSVILKGPLSCEKYQVYSRLSDLGFTVVSHQSKLGVKQHEKEKNSDGPSMKKKRCAEETNEEPKKQRLTFTGAFTSEMKNISKDDLVIDTSNHSMPLCTSLSKNNQDSYSNENTPCTTNVNKAYGDQSKENTDSVSVEVISSEIITIQNRNRHQNDDHNSFKEKNSACSSNSFSVKGNQNGLELNAVAQNGRKIHCILQESVQSNNLQHGQSIIGEIEEIHTNELQHDQSENDKIKEPSGVTFQSSTVESSKDYVDVVDTDHEASCSASELSRDNLSICNSNVNKISQDSFGRSADVPSTSNMNANEDVTSINFKLKEVHNEISVDQSKENDDDEIIIIQKDTPDDFVGHNSLNKMNAVGNSNSISMKDNQTELELDVVAQENDRSAGCYSSADVPSTSNMNANEDVTSINFKLKEVHNEISVDQSKENDDDEIIIIQKDTPDDFVGHNSLNKMNAVDNSNSISMKGNQTELELDVVAQENDKNILCFSEKSVQSNELQHDQSKNDEIEEIKSNDLQHSRSKNDEIEEIQSNDLQHSQSKNNEIEEIHGTDLQHNQSKKDEIEKPLDINSRSPIVESSKDDVYIMDVDTDASCSTSEWDSNVNLVSQDSFCDDKNENSAIVDMNAASNSDIMSCSSIASESNDILALDEEVTILEVTKKETLPLAVIDLLSDEEESAVVTIADEEITVLDEFSLPSTSKISFSRKINSEKLPECKEEVFRTNIKADNYNPILTVNFPDLFKKNIVCVPRPPLQLLPNHVKPVKEAYVLELTPKPRFGQPSGSQEKLWNSYRDLEEYNRKRRFRNQGQNRSAPFSSSPYWNDRNSKTFIKSRKHHQNFFSNRGDSFDQSPHNRSHRHYQNFSSNQGNSFNQSANPHSRSHRRQQNFTDSQADSLAENEDSHNRSHRYHQNFSANQVDTFDSSAKFHNNYQTRDFNGNFGQPVSSFQNHSNFALPNSAINSVITINQHDMNVSMGHNQITHPNILNNALIPGFPPIQMPGLNRMAAGNNLNPHTGSNPHFIREVQRTAYTMATNMVSSMLSRSMLNSPPHLPNPHFMANHSTAHHPFPANTNEFDAPLNILSGNLNSNLSANISGFNQNFGDQQIRPRMRNGVAFPCSYRNVQNKKSWSDVKSAIGESGSDSEIEEIIPDNPRDILWNKRGISPLVKPGVRYPVGTVQKFLQITQKAKVINKYGYSAKLLPSTSSLEISFDVYLPGFPYKKTCPAVPKHRIIVLKSTDPIPKYSDIAILQRKWNDGAFLQLAVVDNGDISFYSFNSLLLPMLIPHQN